MACELWGETQALTGLTGHPVMTRLVQTELFVVGPLKFRVTVEAF